MGTHPIFESDFDCLTDVNIGSYPSWINNYSRVLITMDSTNAEQLDLCRNKLINDIGGENIVDPNLNLQPWLSKGQDVHQIAKEDSPIGAKVRNSVRIINEALDKYGSKGVAIAFNGGKDCTAILHMYFACVALRSENEMNSLYIQSDKEELFDEMEEFLERSHENYQLKVTRKSGGIRQGLQAIKDDGTEIQAILMGTRQDDPHGKYVKEFTVTDVEKGWPEFMRVNPILEWSYEDVWSFIRRLHLPYCVLYDRGYTSLGAKQSTIPNPELKVVDENGKITYRPAYMLTKNSAERSGRN